MNRKIALSSLSILSALALMVGATFAYFSDAGTSSGNTFSTGNLDLKLSDASETDQDTVGASFGGTLVPGGCTGDQTLTLKNTGSVSADHAEVTLVNTVTDNLSAADPDMDTYLRINKLTYDGVDVSGQISDRAGDNNSFLDLGDWAAGSGLDNLSLTNLNIGHDLVLDVCLDSSASNELQTDSVTSLFTVTLNQHSSQ